MEYNILSTFLCACNKPSLCQLSSQFRAIIPPENHSSIIDFLFFPDFILYRTIKIFPRFFGCVSRKHSNFFLFAQEQHTIWQTFFLSISHWWGILESSMYSILSFTRSLACSLVSVVLVRYAKLISGKPFKDCQDLQVLLTVSSLVE